MTGLTDEEKAAMKDRREPRFGAFKRSIFYDILYLLWRS